MADTTAHTDVSTAITSVDIKAAIKATALAVKRACTRPVAYTFVLPPQAASECDRLGDESVFESCMDSTYRTNVEHLSLMAADVSRVDNMATVVCRFDIEVTTSCRLDTHTCLYSGCSYGGCTIGETSGLANGGYCSVHSKEPQDRHIHEQLRLEQHRQYRHTYLQELTDILAQPFPQTFEGYYMDENGDDYPLIFTLKGPTDDDSDGSPNLDELHISDSDDE